MKNLNTRIQSREQISFSEEKKMKYTDLINHVLVIPHATKESVDNFCENAVECGYHSVCVNSSYVFYCAQRLKGSSVRVCSTIGFPFGAMSTAGKVAEAVQAVEDGAAEIETVLHMGMVKSGDWEYIRQDLASQAEAVHARAAVKVILEVCLMTDEEKVRACEVCREAGAEFVKTSTGFSHAGATLEDVMLLHKAAGPSMGVEAFGGICSAADAKAMIEAGAARIGISSNIKWLE